MKEKMMENSELKKYQILDGSWLKIIASVLMAANHAANAFNSVTSKIICTFGGFSISLIRLVYNVSRICFPIYAFLIVEGFLHTHDRKKYGLNLLLFALISEIPWNLEHTGTFLYEKQNVMFTLLFGYLGLCAIEYFQNDQRKQLGSLLGLLTVAVFFNADYGVGGYGFILLLYMLRHNRILQAVIGTAYFSTRWFAGFAFIPLNMYSGKRGFAGNTFFKYAFYLFYPLHLFIIYLIKLHTIGY